MFEELKNVVEQRKFLEASLAKKKAEFNDSIAIETALFKEVSEKEDLLREQVLSLLETEDKDSEEFNGTTFTRAIRRTVKIDDADKLYEFMTMNTDKLEDLGILEDDVFGSFKTTMVISNKDFVNSAIDKFNQVEGQLMDGVILNETKYLTIK